MSRLVIPFGRFLGQTVFRQPEGSKALDGCPRKSPDGLCASSMTVCGRLLKMPVCMLQALQQQMSKAAGLAAERSAAQSSLEDARIELTASEEAAAGLRLELAGSQAEAARLRYSFCRCQTFAIVRLTEHCCSAT